LSVRRIVPNIAGSDLERAKAFYRQVFELELVMDHGWIVTFAADISARPQISVASEGGSGTPVPDISIEVDDVDRTYRRAVDAKCEILYGISDEQWGVRRFYMRDPFGKVLNVLSHGK
jgi:predicted enzyme related to lactoylglutathione lyase